MVKDRGEGYDGEAWKQRRAYKHVQKNTGDTEHRGHRTLSLPTTIMDDSEIEQCFGCSCLRKGSPGCAIKSGWVSARRQYDCNFEDTFVFDMASANNSYHPALRQESLLSRHL